MQIYANPYAYGASGFYFESADDFDRKFAAAERRGVEEFDLEFIDGTSLEAKLFDAAGVNQANVHEWFDLVEELDSDERMVAAIHAAEHEGVRDLEEVKERADDIIVYAGSMRDALEEQLNDAGGIAEVLKGQRKAKVGRRGDVTLDMYFDYDSFGHDVQFDLEPEEAEAYEDMSDQEVGESYIDDVYGDEIPAELVEQYFDWDKYVRDVEVDGSAHEMRFDGDVYTVFP
jgi:hypothetical protein